MPIQPLAPTRLAEGAILGVAVAGPVGHEGAGRHFLGDESAHLLAQLLALGRQTDLIELKLVAHRRVLSRRQHGPELIGAAGATMVAERRRPMAFAAEIVAPRTAVAA